MSDTNISSDVVEVAVGRTPVSLLEEDRDAARQLRVSVDNLTKYRQEIGRIYQMLSNLVINTNALETEISEQRKALVKKYGLEASGSGQWAIDFEEYRFVPLSSSAPVIP